MGVVVLKRLAEAERDGDLIYGVIEGWGVNQDGKTNGITAPNPESQTRLEQEVYERYGIDAGSIQLIEAHGTGTKLGDPVEVEGLKNAFRKYTEKKEYCALGSVKSNIGHCLAAAGVAGAIKVLLALGHKQLPPTINFERLNEHIELKESPFYVNDRLREWELRGGAKRQAAVSSFGFSGTNAHVVVGEYEGVRKGEVSAEVVKRHGNVVVPLSARTKEQLKQKAEDLLAWLEREPGVELEPLAYTLQVGRTAMEERVGLLVSSLQQLTEKLRAYVEGQDNVQDIYKGDTKGNKETLALFTDQDGQQAVEKWMANKKLAKLLNLWVKGLDLDWKKLYGEKAPQRLRLPLYPFAQERYWIDGENGPTGEGMVDGDAAPAAAPQHVGPERATLQLDFHGRRVLPGRSPNTHGERQAGEGSARRCLSGDGPRRYRTGLAPAPAGYCIGIAQYRVSSPNHRGRAKTNQPEVTRKPTRADRIRNLQRRRRTTDRSLPRGRAVD